MIFRLLLTALCGYLLFVAYRFYAHSQPVTAIDLRQSHLAQTNTPELAVVWPEGEDKAGYVKAVQLVVQRMNQQSQDRCSQTQQTAAETQQLNCVAKQLGVKVYAEATAGQDQAVEQARTVVANKNTVAAIGYYRSDTAIPASTVFEHQGVLMLSSGASNVKFTSYDFRHIFRHVPDDNSNARVMADYIQQQGYINLYVIYERDMYGTDFSNYFIEHITERGLKVPVQVFYESNEKDFLPLLSSLRSQISPVNLTDEIALLQAKLQQAKRMEQIHQLSFASNDHIVQFLTAEQMQKNGNNKFFESMPAVKLQQYLLQELEQTADSAYLQLWFPKFQQELSLLSSASQYLQLEQLALEIGQWQQQLAATEATKLFPAKQKVKLNQRLVTRKAIEFRPEDTLSRLNFMQQRIKRIQSGQVDAIFIAGFMPEVAQVIAHARRLNIHLPVFGGHPLADLTTECQQQKNCEQYGEVYALAGHDPAQYQRVYQALQQGVVAEEHCDPASSSCLPERYACAHFETAYQKFQQFAADYQKNYHIKPDHWAVQGYLAASIIQNTIQAAQSFAPELLADTLLYQGNSEFTEKGLMFSCNSLGITEGDVLVEGMKVRKLEDLQVSH